MARPSLPSLHAALALFCFLLVPQALSAPYKYLSYAEIHQRLTALASAHPDILRLYSAQQTFLLPPVGNCTEIQDDGSEAAAPCLVWVVELSNFATLPASPARPEMLVSGLLHGNEVLGPHAVLAYLEHIVRGYGEDPYITRLVDTRLVTLLPITNAIGFHMGERVERQVNGDETLLLDPNRDFGFDQQPEKCMQTVAARTINELFREHLFRLLITFHGGTNAVGYEWGDTDHCTGPVCKPAPDTHMMHALGERMSDSAGPAAKFEAAYPVGDMGKLVYPVNGGLEDWAYGASWAGQGVECEPSTLGGYPKERTKVERTAKRCVTYLVEMSREKKPPEHELGDSDSIMDKGAPGDGHIPRNVRLLLTATDSLEPYVEVLNVTVNAESRPVISWAVGGAFVVDGCAIQWSSASGATHGLGQVLNGTAGVLQAGGHGVVFSQAVAGSLPSSDEAVLFRVATVLDQDMARQAEDSDPYLTPQSHLVGARASTSWNFTNGNHVIQGRRIFFSQTRMLSTSGDGYVVVTDADDTEWGTGQGKAFSMSESDLFAALLEHRSDLDSGDLGNTVAPTDAHSGINQPLTIVSAVAGVAVIVAIAFFLYIFARRKRSQRVRAAKARGSFALVDDDDEADDEERRALTPMDEEEFGDVSGAGEEVASASGRRA